MCISHAANECVTVFDVPGSKPTLVMLNDYQYILYTTWTRDLLGQDMLDPLHTATASAMSERCSGRRVKDASYFGVSVSDQRRGRKNERERERK